MINSGLTDSSHNGLIFQAFNMPFMDWKMSISNPKAHFKMAKLNQVSMNIIEQAASDPVQYSSKTASKKNRKHHQPQ